MGAVDFRLLRMAVLREGGWMDLWIFGFSLYWIYQRIMNDTFRRYFLCGSLCFGISEWVRSNFAYRVSLYALCFGFNLQPYNSEEISSLGVPIASVRVRRVIAGFGECIG